MIFYASTKEHMEKEILEEVHPQVSFLYMKQTILLLIRIFQRRQV